MEQITTATDLRSLAETIAVQGLDAHSATIEKLTDTALRLDPTWVSALVLADPLAPLVVRLRALSHVIADWDHMVSKNAVSKNAVSKNAVSKNAVSQSFTDVNGLPSQAVTVAVDGDEAPDHTVEDHSGREQPMTVAA